MALWRALLSSPVVRGDQGDGAGQSEAAGTRVGVFGAVSRPFQSVRHGQPRVRSPRLRVIILWLSLFSVVSSEICVHTEKWKVSH